MWLWKVDLSGNSWALLPCGEEIKTLQTPVLLTLLYLSLSNEPTAALL